MTNKTQTQAHAPLLVLAGPTASGKSDLALKLARALDRAIISIDSVQVYRGLDIGSAKVLPEQQAGVDHYLLDELDPAQPCDAGWYTRRMEEVLSELARRGRGALMVSGTTLYLSALIHGLAELPRANRELRQTLGKQSNAELFDTLQRLDPDSARRLIIDDRSRVMRAVEVYMVSGKSLSAQLERHAQQSPRWHCLCVLLCWPRDMLYQRINERSRRIVECGLLDETRRIRKEYALQCPALKALGYAQACAVLAGTLTLDDFVPEIAQATRRFAKRQMTFWRNEPPKRGWLRIPEQNYLPGDAHQKEFVTISYTLEELCTAIQRRLSQEFKVSELWHVDAQALFGNA